MLFVRTFCLLVTDPFYGVSSPTNIEVASGQLATNDLLARVSTGAESQSKPGTKS